MVFEYVRHYGPVILLPCMTKLKTGLYTHAEHVDHPDVTVVLICFAHFNPLHCLLFVKATGTKLMQRRHLWEIEIH